MRLDLGMAIAFLFWIVAIGTCAYAAGFGGKDGRWFALIYVTQCFLTLWATWINFNWSSVNWLTFGIDVALGVAFGILALRSRKFWPIWVFGIHFITISAHLATLFAGSVPIQAYFIVATMWSLPKLLIVVIGIHMDRRAFMLASLSNEGKGSA